MNSLNFKVYQFLHPQLWKPSVPIPLMISMKLINKKMKTSKIFKKLNLDMKVLPLQVATKSIIIKLLRVIFWIFLFNNQLPLWFKCKIFNFLRALIWTFKIKEVGTNNNQTLIFKIKFYKVIPNLMNSLSWVIGVRKKKSPKTMMT